MKNNWSKGFINIELHIVYTVYILQQYAFKARTLLGHRGLKLDGAIGQGEIFNSLKSENFSKSFLSHIGKNRIKF